MSEAWKRLTATKEADVARYAIVGAVVFGVCGVVFGVVWVAFEAPFVMALQWAAGGAALGWISGGGPLALKEALAGGLTYLVAFLFVFLVVLAVVEFPAPLALAAGLTGVAMGAYAGGREAALRVGLAAAAGFAAGEAALALIASLQPAAAAEPGAVQYAWFALGQGVMGAIGGAVLGVGFGSLHPREVLR